MINRYVAVGRLTKDPELRKTANGVSVINFIIAVNRERKDSSGSYPADFINCQTWRQSADYLSRYAKKGSLISVDGRIETGSYEKNGYKNYTWHVNCDSVNLIGRKDVAGESKDSPVYPEQDYPGYPQEDWEQEYVPY